ncbi:MAG: hypothetical protein ACPGJV_14525 [Bacteriovoracaceae bacterium]
MSLKKIILIGASGVAHEIIDTLFDINKVSPEWEILGILDDAPEKKDLNFYRDIKVLGTAELIKDFDLSEVSFFVTFSSPANFLNRKAYIEGLNSSHPGIKFANIIHPTAYLSETAKMGTGCFVGHNVHLDSLSKLGDHNIVLFNSIISRFVEIDDYSFVSANVNITGNKKIGSSVYLGVKTTINANVGDCVLVSAGSFINSDVEDMTLASTKTEQNVLKFKTLKRFNALLSRH